MPARCQGKGRPDLRALSTIRWMRTRPLAVLLALSLSLGLAGCDREGPQGAQGVPGPQGVQGPQGNQGPAAPSMAFGYFYAQMPGDNPATVAIGTAVQLPQDGAASGIVRVNAGQFILPQAGTYEVSWQVSVTEPGQLVLARNGLELAHTVAGRATGTSQITNHVLIAGVAAGDILELRNPAGGIVAMTITPLAGGTQPVSASLLIKQIQ